MKSLKRVFKVLSYLFGIVIKFLIGSTVYHHIKLSVEKESIVPNGILVTVDGYKMHVYAEGEKSNRPTLVIMSGSGIPAPVYDYKALYSQLSDEYRVVVIEKFGYGYSDISGLSRDVERMVKQNREALTLAGEQGPYILLPHSMSALEAIYWAENYPDEVSAIVGLDMAVPEEYEPYTGNNSGIKLLRIIPWLGLHRIPFPKEVSQHGLTPEEIKQHKYLSNKVILNSDIMAEASIVNDNAKKVLKYGTPDIPMLLFVSSEMGGQWMEKQQSFAANSNKITLIKLDCGHNIHCFEAEYIAKETKKFMNGLFVK